MFYTGECQDTPCMFVHPHMFVFPCTFVCPHGCTHPHMSPILLHLYVLRGFCMLKGYKGPLTCWTPPLHPPVWECLPLITPLHSFSGFPVHWYVLGISLCHMGNISHMLGVWKVFPQLLGVLGVSAHGVSICLFLYYYSPNYSGVFWTVICFISDWLPSLMGLPVTLDQCGVVQPPPLMLRGSEGVICPASVPQHPTPSLMPLLAYANYAMGASQVDLFFRVEPPTVLYASAFYF